MRRPTYKLNSLAIIKESNPIEVAEFAAPHDYVKESAFQWWVPHVLRKKRWIINKVKSCVRKRRKMKFGIEAPDTVE